MSRLFALGDIHGCLEPLRTVLAHIKPCSDDTFIILGDLIDRGSNSKAVIDCVLQLQQQCDVRCILGNHEEMLLNAQHDSNMREMWLYHGGQETLQSFGLPPNAAGLAHIPPPYIDFLQHMLPFVETEQYIFSHATPNLHTPMAQQDAHGLRWQRCRLGGAHNGTQRHISNKIVVCGHTPQSTGKPLVTPAVVVIDTYAYGGAWLTALELHSKIAHQANAQGAYRTLVLDWHC